MFDAGSQVDKELWIDILNKYTTTGSHSTGRLPG